jgi:hypothetical protein
MRIVRDHDLETTRPDAKRESFLSRPGARFERSVVWLSRTHCRSHSHLLVHVCGRCSAEKARHDRMIIALVDALVSLTDAGHLRAPACEACSNVHAPRHTHGVIIKSAALTFSPRITQNALQWSSGSRPFEPMTTAQMHGTMNASSVMENASRTGAGTTLRLKKSDFGAQGRDNEKYAPPPLIKARLVSDSWGLQMEISSS